MRNKSKKSSILLLTLTIIACLENVRSWPNATPAHSKRWRREMTAGEELGEIAAHSDCKGDLRKMSTSIMLILLSLQTYVKRDGRNLRNQLYQLKVSCPATQCDDKWHKVLQEGYFLSKTFGNFILNKLKEVDFLQQHVPQTQCEQKQQKLAQDMMITLHLLDITNGDDSQRLRDVADPQLGIARIIIRLVNMEHIIQDELNRLTQGHTQLDFAGFEGYNADVTSSQSTQEVFS